jgi:hypothetical protein
MFRLPDLPIVGYATDRERQGTDAIMLFMREVERDRLKLLTIVCDGKEKWRRGAGYVFGTALNIDDDILDEIFWYFTLQCARPRGQWYLMKARGNSLATRAIIRMIMPHIEREREAVLALKQREARFGFRTGSA